MTREGTGKTYASAFAMRDLGFKKILFLVHREEIARQAKESYNKVFKGKKRLSFLSGSTKMINDKVYYSISSKDFINTLNTFDDQIVFSTMQTMSNNLNEFDRNYFDSIIIDETHRAGAMTYQKIFNYFNPKLWLGMTATPERTDDFNIFELFDYNIACEIRLNDALKNDLLCPFHYFGISELSFDDIEIGDDTDFSSFNKINVEKRVSYILEKAEYYGYSGSRLKGLVFCSTVNEAQILSDEFTKRGYKTISLGGKNSMQQRKEGMDKLLSDDEEQLDYIFTVDIFNEGVDLPDVNQIIMLRPTQSPIVFVQQLGRGLRKTPNKDFVVVLDFIGNYNNNYMIPIALSGDKSYNKDNLRKYIISGNEIIYGESSINFDEISRKKILKSIDSARTNSMKLIKDSYFNLKNKVGRIPLISDFKEHGEIDMYKIFSHNKLGSYHVFLENFEKDYKVNFSSEQVSILKFLSKKLARAKRPHELYILKVILDDIKSPRNEDIIQKAERLLFDTYHIEVSDLERESMIHFMRNEFTSGAQKNEFASAVFIENIYGAYEVSKEFKKHLEDSDFYHAVEEILYYALDVYESKYKYRYKDTHFVLAEKYSYEDVCHLLNWEKNLNAQNIGGYFYDKRTKTLPVFINYDKTDDAIKYEDRFYSKEMLIALSKKARTSDSSDADHIFKRKLEDKENRIYLFVRKNKDDKEAKEFYFLGEVQAAGNPISKKIDDKSVFEIQYNLEHSVREDLYHYIVE